MFLPLRLVYVYFCFSSSDCQFPRAWLLPIMKESIKETELQYFIDEFLPIAAHLKNRGTFYDISLC